MASALRVTLMLVDDHPLVAEGFKALLEPEFRVVAVVHEPDDVPEAYRRLRPDIVALDIALPGKSGLQLATELLQEWPDARIVMLTMHGQQDYVDRARELGARGFVLKLADVEELRSALRTVFAGGEYFAKPTPVAGRRQRRLQLTGQQTNVLRLVGQGCTSAEIGQQLEIDIRTVEYHRAAIKKALGLTSNAALVRYALTDGLAE
jgi:two-component system, NarL family, nitrate/nitrite response regulator NarL